MKIQVTLIKKWTLEKIEWTNLWRVVSPYIWEIRNWKVREVKVPKWFVTDFWSIPRVLWVFMNPTEYHSYILHDYLYKHTILSRKLSDLSLQIGLLSEWAYWLEAYTVWVWVRIGGWIYYNYQKNKNKYDWTNSC